MTDSPDFSADAAWLERVLSTLFPPPCATAWRLPSWPSADLPEAEAAAIVNAVDRRQAEFAAGRNSARQALAHIGLPGSVIPAGPDRAPLWPQGAVGSIAHAEGMAVAVAARAREILGVGVDIERSGRVKEELWPHILTPAELREAQRRPAAEGATWATTVFVIKEAFYKFQYPQTRRWLNFEEVEVTQDPAGSFSLLTDQPLKIGSKEMSQFSGLYAVGPKFTLAGVHIRLS